MIAKLRKTAPKEEEEDQYFLVYCANNIKLIENVFRYQKAEGEEQG